jgi:hypothetical protein
MKEHPIAFSTPMMRAYLAGLKGETRRILGGESPACPDHGTGCPDLEFQRCHWADRGEVWTDGWTGYRSCPYGQPGDLLRIKEDLRVNGAGTTAVYAADGLPVMVDGESLDWRWKSSRLPARFMPTIACRARPPVLEVRVERLRAITEEGAYAEGIYDGTPCLCSAEDYVDAVRHCLRCGGRLVNLIDDFAAAWDSINGKRAPWSADPFVWVVRFEPISSKED